MGTSFRLRKVSKRLGCEGRACFPEAVPVSLKSLYPQLRYSPLEKTFEDDWARRGGDACTGKLYVREYFPGMSKKLFMEKTSGIEILSMGIQRMLESPVDFQRQDPKFYNFIKSQLS